MAQQIKTLVSLTVFVKKKNAGEGRGREAVEKEDDDDVERPK